MRLYKIIVCWWLGALCCFSSPVWANNYHYFTFDLGDTWVEIMPEDMDQAGNFQLNLFSDKLHNMLSIITVDIQQPATLQCLENSAQYMIGRLKQQGFRIDRQWMEQGTKTYKAQGKFNGLDFEMHIFMHGSIVCLAVSSGDNIKQSLGYVQHIVFK